MRASLWVVAGSLACLGFAPARAADGAGLTAKADAAPWARWQDRLALDVQTPLQRANFGSGPTSGLQVRSVSLMRDYYLTRSLIGAGTEGGLHTTGGLILSTGSAAAGQAVFGARPGGLSVARRIVAPNAGLEANDPNADSTATVPYLGVGYIGQSAKGGWSFSADLGLMALAAGNAVKFGRVVNGSQSLYDLAREMRLAPVMQMGISYSF